jgi:hypothetical protein
VEFRVLREHARGFWLMWKALGYQEGPQFSHAVDIVSAAAAGVRGDKSSGQGAASEPPEVQKNNAPTRGYLRPPKIGQPRLKAGR